MVLSAETLCLSRVSLLIDTNFHHTDSQIATANVRQQNVKLDANVMPTANVPAELIQPVKMAAVPKNMYL